MAGRKARQLSVKSLFWDLGKEPRDQGESGEGWAIRLAESVWQQPIRSENSCAFFPFSTKAPVKRKRKKDSRQHISFHLATHTHVYSQGPWVGAGL